MTPRERLADARLYLVCDARPRAFLDAALRGGVDIIQLRDKTLDDDGLDRAAAQTFRAAADAHGALFILNDRPDLVEACGADGVHVGQDDGTPAAARAAVGPGPRSSAAPRTRPRRPTRPTPTPTSTTSPSARCTRRRPSRAAPPRGSTTSPTRPRTVGKPWFAIGGLDAATLPEVVERGARRASWSCARSPRRPTRRRAAARAARRARRCPLGQRSRKRRCGASAAPPRTTPETSLRARGEPRAIRRRRGRGARLRPLARARRRRRAPSSSRSRRASGRSRSRSPRSSPPLLAVANVVALRRRLGGRSGSQPSRAGCSSSASCSSPPRSACGAAQYWAVLGFQALLGDLDHLTAACRCCVASNVAGGRAAALAVIAVCGPLFWFLIRAMARMQMPTRTR